MRRHSFLKILCILLWLYELTAFAIETSIVETLKLFKDEEQISFDTKKNELSLTYLADQNLEERQMAALGTGILYLEREPRLSLQFLTAAKTITSNDQSLFQIIKIYQAQALVKLGIYTHAINILNQLNPTTTGRFWYKKAKKLLLESYFYNRNYSQYLKEYNKFEKTYFLEQEDEDLKKFAVISYETTKHFALAFETLEDLAALYPITEYSRWAFQKLISYSCESAPNKYFFSKNLLYKLSKNQILDPGLKEFIIAALDTPIMISKNRTETLSLKDKAEILLQMRFYDQASALVEQIQDELSSNQKIKDDMLLLLGRIYVNQGNYEKGAFYYSKYLSLNPFGDKSLRVREILARIFSQQSYYPEAAKTFSMLVNRGGRRDLRWHHFWSEYQSNELQNALNLVDQTRGYVISQDLLEPSSPLYWKGRILEKLGNTDAAKEIYKGIIRQNPQSYYSVLILARFPAFQEIYIQTAKATSATEETRYAANTTKRNELSNIPIDSDLKIARDLLKLGLKQQASLQLKSKFTTKPKDPLEIYAISKFAFLADDYQKVQKVARNSELVDERGMVFWQDTDMENKTLVNIFYPLAYENIIDTFSSIAEVDHLLVLSIIKAESEFNPTAVSPVGAQGLMQIMPYTATKIAEDLEDYQFSLNSLTKEKTNIAYGTYYIKKLLDYYDQNIILAIAAYNAGPIAVNDWLKRCNECDTDEFVENIPYQETRRYVKEVFRNLANYKKIYQNKPALGQLPSLLDSPEDVSKVY